MADQAPSEPRADAGQKQKKKRIQQDFQETTRWEHDEQREDDIEDFIRSELKIVNDRAGLSVVPGAHRRRDNRYGLFVMGNTRVTNKGSTTNTILRCPLWERCKMPFWGEHRDIFYDNYSLHFKSSHIAAPQQRKGQICVYVCTNLCL